MSSNRDRFIERILSGEVDMNSDEVREACREDPELARDLDETLQTLASLDEELVLAEIARADDGESGENIAHLVQRELRARAKPKTRGLWPLLAAAVAASILFVAFFDKGDGTPNIPPTPLGGELLECIAPSGEHADYSIFRWQNGATGGTYSIEVYGEDGRVLEGGTSGPLGDVREWIPESAATGQWKGGIEWRLRWDRPGGGKAEIVFAEATP